MMGEGRRGLRRFQGKKTEWYADLLEAADEKDRHRGIRG
jgi:hypothetical protein